MICNWVGQKKKEKTETKLRTGPAPLGGSCVGGKVSTHWEAPSWVETAGGGEGKLQSHGGEPAIGAQKAKQRDSHTEDRHRPPLTSPRGLSAPPPGQVGAGS